MKPKILLVHNYYKIPGGEDTVVQNEKRLLEENGHVVISYFRNNNEMDNFPIWRKALLPFTSIFSIKTYKDMKDIIKKEGIDIVHVHNTLSLVSPSVFYATFCCKVPVVQTLHNFRMLCPGALFYREGHICEDCVNKGLLCAVKYKCYRNSHMQSAVSAAILMIHRLLGTYRKVSFICLTDFNKEKLLTANSKKRRIVEKRKIYVKPNFTSNSIAPIPYNNRKDQYIYIGRLEEVKGIQLVLEAFREIPDSRLVVCGTGPMKEWCLDFIEKNRMDHVVIMGQTEHKKVIEILSESKALIFSSQLYEGLPMSILESYAAGTPVIGCDIGNGGNLILDDNCKIKMNHSFGDELIRCMRYLESDKFQGIDNVMSYYSIDTAYDKLESIYMDILGRMQSK